MSDMLHHTTQIWHFDGLLHWCFLLSIVGFAVSLIWALVRVLLPLRCLVQQANRVMDGNFAAFDTPVQGIREVEQLQYALQHMMGQIIAARDRESAYRTALTESQEHERLRIAREIHDDAIQSLILVAHSIERSTQAAHSAQLAVITHLETARRQLIAAIDGLRQMIGNLRPTTLDELGLVAALEMLCEQHQTLDLCVRGEAIQLESAVELTLFRAAQEAIRNAERHANARTIAVTLTYSTAAVILEVNDNGVGFQIPSQLQAFASRGHFGLMGMCERIHHIGGQLHLKSEPGLGSRVIVRLPAAERQRQLVCESELTLRQWA
ncbi:MAG: sensor histidine kinase [Chloroflexota bacterium]|nr:sensor histidine kinase [Chloroflexota bacterium]